MKKLSIFQLVYVMYFVVRLHSDFELLMDKINSVFDAIYVASVGTHLFSLSIEGNYWDNIQSSI